MKTTKDGQMKLSSKEHIEIEVSDLRKMIEDQFPEWAGLSITKLETSGTVNGIFSLGEKLCVRVPKRNSGVEQIKKEMVWLPRLSKSLPLQIPKPLAVGEPCEQYPMKWAVYEWIDGENLTPQNLNNSTSMVNAKQLAAFIDSLQKVDTAGGPAPGAHNYYRGEKLIARDQETREKLHRIRDFIDTKIAEKVWEEALGCASYEGKTWIHGDLMSGNLLSKNGRVKAIIDFGALAVGDPACDLLPAWNLFGRKEREVFRSNLKVDEKTWKRGMGWALSIAVIAFEYYNPLNHDLARMAKYAFQEIEKDYVIS